MFDVKSEILQEKIEINCVNHTISHYLLNCLIVFEYFYCKS